MKTAEIKDCYGHSVALYGAADIHGQSIFQIVGVQYLIRLDQHNAHKLQQVLGEFLKEADDGKN